MSQIAIRCHPYAPVAAEDLHRWLTTEVEHLSEDVPAAAIRLLRLSQAGPEGEIGVGWQIELGISSPEPPLNAQSMAELLRDLRLLGLQPSVLQAQNSPNSAWDSNLEPVAADRPLLVPGTLSGSGI
jgi:hypothetical protein